MLTQTVKNYKFKSFQPTKKQNAWGESFAEKRLIFHIIPDNTKNVNILDIGFGLGGLGELVKSSKTTSHWEVDGIDGDKANCNNPKLLKKSHYRNIWHGAANDIPGKLIKKYDILCLLDVIEHLEISLAMSLLKHLLLHMREDAYLFISSPLWFYPQEGFAEGDLKEHRIGIPASSMMNLEPVMYALGYHLVGSFVLEKKSLKLVHYFQPTIDVNFSIEKGISVALKAGMNLEIGKVHIRGKSYKINTPN